MPKKNDMQVTVSPDPAPIGTAHLDFSGSGFKPRASLTGTVSGRGPSFPVNVDSDGAFTAAWDNSAAPLGIGAGGGVAEMHWLSISDERGEEVFRAEFMVE